MPKKKNDMLQLQQNFAREMLETAVIIPKCLLDIYVQLGLNEKELVNLIKLLDADKSRKIGCDEIASICSVSSSEAEALADKLLSSNLMTCTKEGYFDFGPLFNVLLDNWMFKQITGPQPQTEAKTAKPLSKNAKLIRSFEQELGRALSSIELEKIAEWVSVHKIPDNIILEALNRSVMQGKTSFAYINRILQNWQKEGFKTLEEIKVRDKNRTENGRTANYKSTEKKSNYETLMK